MTETTLTRDVTIAGRAFRLRSADVLRAAATLEPEPIARHYVVVEQRRFPPKQLICALTGLDRADLTTHQARRTLMRLGFQSGRRGGEASSAVAGAAQESALTERLRPLAGQWVAVKDDDVLHHATTPAAVVGWLTRHGRQADSMFRVPEDDRAASGLAPL